MSGYAASSTIQGIGPHVVRARSTRAADALDRDPDPAAAPCVPALGDWVELVGRPLDERLAEWWAGVREAVSQTTFFLFDPESWR